MKMFIENMYGFQKDKKFIFDEEKKKHHIIYGVNGSGKTSIAKSISHILSNKDYIPQLPSDETNFNIVLEFDKLGINNKNYTKDEIYYEAINKVYIFNKDYILNNLVEGKKNNFGGYIYLAERIVEKNNLKKEMENIYKEFGDYILASAKSNGFSGGKKDYFDKTLISVIKTTGNSKLKLVEDVMKKAVKNDKIKVEYIDKIRSVDFITKNIELYIKTIAVLKSLEKEFFYVLKKKIKQTKYNFKDYKNIEFYESVIKYLRSNSDDKKCPVCVESNIDAIAIANSIEKAIEEVFFSNSANELKSLFNDIAEIKGSHIADFLINIRNEIFTDKNINKKNIILVSDIIEYLEKNYDELLYSIIIGNDYDKNKIEGYFDKKTNCEKIDFQNKKNKKNKFISVFKETITLIFKNDRITPKVDISDNQISLRLDYDENDKGNLSIDGFVKNVLSESEKTKLSLAYFISTIIYKNINERNKKILCIFDDPIDSYDSISKYEINNVIYQFLNYKNNFKKYRNKYNVFSIVLSHSYEYLRIYKNNYSDKELEKDNIFYILTRNGVEKINSNYLFLLDGDLSILNHYITKYSVDNKKISIDEYIMIMPMLRELSANASNIYKIFSGGKKIGAEIGGKEINSLKQELSKNLFHPTDIKSLGELKKEIDKYITLEVDEIEKYESLSLKDYIEKRISQPIETINFVDSLIMKSLIALYIRSFYNENFTRILKDVIKLSKTKINRLGDNFSKIKEIEKNKVVYSEYKDLIFSYYNTRVKYNDYGHSANYYFIPLFDVPIGNLIAEFNLLNSYKIKGVKGNVVIDNV